MKSKKRKTPYQMLMEDAREFASKVKYRHEKPMWRYPKENLNAGWHLADIAERVSAADQLGYDVILKNTADGLCVYYRKKVPDTPIGWQL